MTTLGKMGGGTGNGGRRGRKQPTLPGKVATPTEGAAGPAGGPANSPIGVQAIARVRGRDIKLSALDFSGRTSPLMVEKHPPADQDPRVICPSCLQGLLSVGPISGANSLRKVTCRVCQVKWQTSEELLGQGIGLEMC